MNWSIAIGLMFVLYAIVYWIRWWREQRYMRKWLKELLEGTVEKENADDVDSNKEGGREDYDRST